MSKKQRIYYKPRWCSLNSRYLTGLRDVSMSVNFDLEQCFCSCAPFPLQSMLDEWHREQAFFSCVNEDIREWIEVHHDDCPNAKKGFFRRYVTEEEHEKYREIYRRK